MKPVLQGNRRIYTPNEFPYHQAIRAETILQHMHVVVPTDQLTEEFRTLSDFDPHNESGVMSRLILQFTAEAVNNTMKLRGVHAGHENIGSNPRIRVLLSYITKELFSNPQQRDQLEPQFLFQTTNVVALVFHILLFDEDLDLGDAFSDQLEINEKGYPSFLKKDTNLVDADGAADGNLPPDLQIQILAPVVANIAAGNPGNQPPPAPRVFSRPDKPHCPLTEHGSRYCYPQHGNPNLGRNGEYREKGKFSSKGHVLTGKMAAFTRINFTSYLLMSQALLGDHVYTPSTVGHIGSTPQNSMLRPEVRFSFDNMLRSLRSLGAHEIFLDRENWFCDRFVDDEVIHSFGAPCWPTGPGIWSMELQRSIPSYRAGVANVTAAISFHYFNGVNVLADCLPHCQTLDGLMIGPNKTLVSKTISFGQAPAVGRAHREPNPEMEGVVVLPPVNEQPQGKMTFTDILHSMGVETEADRMLRDQESYINHDPFNRYFDVYGPRWTEAHNLNRDPQNPTPEYIEFTRNMRQQGWRNFLSMYHYNSEKLPTGYRALITYVTTQPPMKAIPNDIWHSGENRLSLFSQFITKQLVEDESIIRIADSMLFDGWTLLRCLYTTYLPRIGTRLHKEHIQFVCGPGASKSDTITKIVKHSLIPDTYDIRGGASSMGQFGARRSERMPLIYHEIPQSLAPIEVPKGEAADKTHKMLLMMLAEGLFSYMTTAEKPDSRGFVSGAGKKEPTAERSEFTGVFVGSRNVNPRTDEVAHNDTVAAMYDRQTLRNVVAICPKDRVDIFSQLLAEATSSSFNISGLNLTQNRRLLHRIIMEYGAACCYFAVPLPDTGVFSALSPLAVAFLATVRPGLHAKMRNTVTMTTRILMLCLWTAAKKGMFTALNPSSNISRAPDGSEQLVVDAYDMKKNLTEIAHYAYTTMDQTVFVLTEFLNEILGGSTNEILRHICQRFAGYFRKGDAPHEQAPNHQYNYWPSDQEIDNMENEIRETLTVLPPGMITHVGLRPPSFVPPVQPVYKPTTINDRMAANINPTSLPVDIPTPAAVSASPGFNTGRTGLESVEKFVDRLLQNPVYFLGKPTLHTKSVSTFAARRNQGGRTDSSGQQTTSNFSHVEETGYVPFELKEVVTDDAFDEIYRWNATSEQNVMLSRTKPPEYKEELYGGETWINPNYVALPGPLQSLAKIAAGNIGKFKLDENTTYGILNNLKNDMMIAPYLPLLKCNTPSTTVGRLNQVQSLRYTAEMRRFPKFNVPTLIVDVNKKKVYILVAALELDTEELARGMIEHVSYEGTRPERVVLGIPNYDTLLYKHYDLKPISGKSLRIGTSVNVRSSTAAILKQYCQFSPELNNGEMQEAGLNEMQTLRGESGHVFKDKDIVEHFALAFLRRSWPDEPLERLKMYTPSGVEARLWGPNGFYTKARTLDLQTKPYPEVLASVSKAAEEQFGSMTEKFPQHLKLQPTSDPSTNFLNFDKPADATEPRISNYTLKKERISRQRSQTLDKALLEDNGRSHESFSSTSPGFGKRSTAIYPSNSMPDYGSELGLSGTLSQNPSLTLTVRSKPGPPVTSRPNNFANLGAQLQPRDNQKKSTGIPAGPNPYSTVSQQQFADF